MGGRVMKMIRWQGLIAFIVVVGAVALFWLVIVDSAVKGLIEKAGTAVVGAKVDLGNADVTFMPLGVTLTRLQVTDKDEPMTNVVEVSRIAFSLDNVNLFRRKVIIDEMAAEGIRFNTPRATSGAVAKAPKPQPKEEQPGFKLPAVDLPDVKTVLANEKLESLDRIEAARAEMTSAKTRWDQRLAELPDSTRIKSYRDRLKDLKGSGKLSVKALAGQAKEAAALAKEVEADLQQVKKAKSDFSADLSGLRKSVDEAARSPMADLRRIRDRYGFSAEGLSNMTNLLFGASIRQWVDRGLNWYGKLQPMLARSGGQTGAVKTVKPLRGAGMNVRFPERNPLPDFLIRKIAVSLQPTAGSFTGTVVNMTPDQNVLGKPTTFAFSGENLEHARSAVMDGEFNHVAPAQFSDRFGMNMQDIKIDRVILSRSEEMPVTLEQGLVNLTLTGTSRREGISGRFTATVRDARIAAGGTSTNAFATSISSALTKVNAFSLTADISGTLEKPAVRISSDLDRVLKDAVGGLVREKAAKFEMELNAAIEERTGGALKGLQGDVAGLDGVGGKLSARQDELEAILKDAAGKAKNPF